MAQILEFIPRTDSFGPEAVQALVKAYDMALAALQDMGQPDIVCEVVAKRIIREANKGEMNPAKLRAVALSVRSAKARSSAR